MNRWVQEVEHLCADLGAWTQTEQNAILIEHHSTILRLTAFQGYFLIAIGVLNQMQKPQWVGFATIAHNELPEFLSNTL